MNIFKKKNKSQNLGRRNDRVEQGSSAPVVRYYRPESKTSNKISREPINNKNINFKNRQKLSGIGIFSLILRWFGVFAILFITLANTTLSSSDVKISKSTDQNDLYKSQKTYVSEVNNIFNSSIFNKSKFTLSSSKFEQQIKSRFPEVEQATVIIPLAGRQLQVDIVIAKPLARLQLAQNTPAVVSENGVIIDVNNDTQTSSSLAQLPMLSVPNVTYNEGESILTSEEIRLIMYLKQEFDGSENYRPMLSSLEYDIQKREIRTRFEGMNFYAKLTPERNPREQVGSLVSTLKSLTEQGILPPEYIDVRVEDRVFVK